MPVPPAQVVAEDARPDERVDVGRSRRSRGDVDRPRGDAERAALQGVAVVAVVAPVRGGCRARRVHGMELTADAAGSTRHRADACVTSRGGHRREPHDAMRAHDRRAPHRRPRAEALLDAVVGRRPASICTYGEFRGLRHIAIEEKFPPAAQEASGGAVLACAARRVSTTVRSRRCWCRRRRRRSWPRCGMSACHNRSRRLTACAATTPLAGHAAELVGAMRAYPRGATTRTQRRVRRDAGRDPRAERAGYALVDPG